MNAGAEKRDCAGHAEGAVLSGLQILARIIAREFEGNEALGSPEFKGPVLSAGTTAINEYEREVGRK